MIDAIEQVSQNPVLTGQVRAATKARNDGARASLAALFELGQIARDIKDRPAGLPWYPERMERGRAFDLFAMGLGERPRKLYEALHIVSIYTAEQLEMFLTGKSETYQQMTLEHLRVITWTSTDAIPASSVAESWARFPGNGNA